MQFWSEPRRSCRLSSQEKFCDKPAGRRKKALTRISLPGIGNPLILRRAVVTKLFSQNQDPDALIRMRNPG
jgi:hypothetical protein